MSEKYLLDTNVFLTPYESYYAPDIVPSFWGALEEVFIKSNSIAVLDLVIDEILKGEDGLKTWIQNLWDQHEIQIISHSDVKIIESYGQVMQYLQESPYYTDRTLRNWAKDNIADPWLIATANAYEYTIITFEVPSGVIDIKSPTSRPKIPTVGKHFGITCQNLYYFMRKMGIKI